MKSDPFFVNKNLTEAPTLPHFFKFTEILSDLIVILWFTRFEHYLLPPKIRDFQPKVGIFWVVWVTPKSADFRSEITNLRG